MVMPIAIRAQKNPANHIGNPHGGDKSQTIVAVLRQPEIKTRAALI